MLTRLPFFYGWVIVAVTFVTMAIGVNAPRFRWSLHLSSPSSVGNAVLPPAPSRSAFWFPRPSAR
jgi:hypothetical protein